MKKGTRVKMIKSIDNPKLAPVGKCGTVLDEDENDLLGNLVEFDEAFPNGHDGGCNEATGKEGHCWYCSDAELEKLTT